MLFCERKKARTIREVQNATLKSYRNTKKYSGTQTGATFWYQCLKFTSKPPNNV